MRARTLIYWSTMGFSALAALPATGFATTVLVSMSGADSGACGPAGSPCRTITQAIANAATGDTIVVGPGRYGSHNADGDFLDTGEENSGVAGKMIVVNKQVTMLSSGGPNATVLNCQGLSATGVSIENNGVVFGKKGKGFNVASCQTGIATTSTTTDVLITGNVTRNNATEDVSLDGTANEFVGNYVDREMNVLGTAHVLKANRFDGSSGELNLDGSDHVVSKNQAVDVTISTMTASTNIVLAQNVVIGDSAGLGFNLQGTGHILSKNAVQNRGAPGYYCTGTCSGLTFKGNTARNCGSDGFYLGSGTGHVLTGNLSGGNSGSGFYVAAFPSIVTFEKNVAVGNLASGFVISPPNNPTLLGNAAIGNMADGIQVNGPAIVNGNSIYGNGPGGTNCGLTQTGATLADATDNFWGVAAGPSATEPADNVCGNTAFVDATSPAATEFKVKSPKAP